MPGFVCTDRGTVIFYIVLCIASISSCVRSFCIGENNALLRARHCRTKSAVPYRRPSTASTPIHSQSQTKLWVRIRDWRQDDVPQIQSLLLDAEEFRYEDPEGALDVDIGSAATIQESYNFYDGGCFLVATDDKDDSFILGTAGLIVGTPSVTAAVRRVCTVNNNKRENDSTLKALLVEIENRAVRSGAIELNILAYTSSKRRPYDGLLSKMEYKKLPTNLPDVVEYRKALDNDDSSPNILKIVAGTVFVAGWLLASWLVAMNLMGPEPLPFIGTPEDATPSPTIQEIQRLKQDEQVGKSASEKPPKKEEKVEQKAEQPEVLVLKAPLEPDNTDEEKQTSSSEDPAREEKFEPTNPVGEEQTKQSEDPGKEKQDEQINPPGGEERSSQGDKERDIQVQIQ